MVAAAAIKLKVDSGNLANDNALCDELPVPFVVSAAPVDETSRGNVYSQDAARDSRNGVFLRTLPICNGWRNELITGKDEPTMNIREDAEPPSPVAGIDPDQPRGLIPDDPSETHLSLWKKRLGRVPN